MPLPTLPALMELATRDLDGGVSIYFSRGANPEKKEGLIRLKTAVDDAESQLEARGIPGTDTRSRLDPLRELEQDAKHWNQPHHGVAAFSAPDFFRHHIIKSPFPPLTAVGSVFHVRPLLRELDDAAEFYILALSGHEVRLLYADRHDVEELDLPSEAPEEAGDFSRPQQERRRTRLQLHTIATGGGPTSGAQPGVFHSHGDRERPETEWTLQYLRYVDDAVTDRLEDSHLPLVFAGDVSLFPLYKEANTYPALLEEFVRGNPEHRNAEELAADARKLVDASRTESRRRTLELVHEAVGKDQGTVEIAPALHAAVEGRVQTLLAAREQKQWGRFDPQSGNVQSLPDREADSEDLINLAVVHVLRHGGSVVEVEPEAVPQNSSVAAMFRF